MAGGAPGGARPARARRRRPDRLSRGCGPGARGPTGDSVDSGARRGSFLRSGGWGGAPGAPARRKRWAPTLR
eukprot:5575836-Pleurochrysis_carterae.AAC.1